MSDLSRALDQLSEIREQMAKGDVFRGYKPLPLAIAGLLGLIAGLAQSALIPMVGSLVGPFGLDLPKEVFLAYWLSVAAVAAAIPAIIIGYRYLIADDAFARAMTHRAIGQFLPSLAAGMIVTAAFAPLSESAVLLLPGLWSVLFALGTFSSRPYLPRATGWVALFYLGAGSFMLTRASEGFVFLGQCLGVSFAIGQWATAAVLYFNIERKWL